MDRFDEVLFVAHPEQERLSAPPNDWDNPLSSIGELQIKKMISGWGRAFLKDMRDRVVVSSPPLRCKNVVEPFGATNIVPALYPNNDFVTMMKWLGKVPFGRFLLVPNGDHVVEAAVEAAFQGIARLDLPAADLLVVGGHTIFNVALAHRLVTDREIAAEHLPNVRLGHAEGLLVDREQVTHYQL